MQHLERPGLAISDDSHAALQTIGTTMKELRSHGGNIRCGKHSGKSKLSNGPRMAPNGPRMELRCPQDGSPQCQT